MKTRFPSMFGLLAVFMLVASLVVPANMVNPAPVEADPGVLEWSILDTPESVPNLTKEILNPENFMAGAFANPKGEGSELRNLVVGSNGSTMYVIVNHGPNFRLMGIGGGYWTGANWPTAATRSILYGTGTGGWMWSALPSANLADGGAGAVFPVWDVVLAPDDPNFIAVVTSDVTGRYPSAVWVSDDGGTSWDNTLVPIPAAAGALGDVYISCIDISPDYGGKRDIAVGTRDTMQAVAGKVWTLPVPGFGNWLDQSWNNALGGDNPAGAATWLTAQQPSGDVFDIKFSPTYVGDATLVVACSSNLTTDGATFVGPPNGCFVNTAVRDLDKNTSVWGNAVWVSDPATSGTFSASCNETVDMDLELPSDFSGQAASLRRFYVSIDDGGGWYRSIAAGLAAYPIGQGLTESGIYRIDDTTVYELMDTTTSFTVNGPIGKRISTIAYYGTYASGKLLAGEVRGDPCWATVPTWFTDSPTTCPIPCWYPAKKPTTGSGAVPNCATANPGWGNACVAWSPDGATAYVVTSSNQPGPWAFVAAAGYAALQWPRGLLNLVPLDESAFALSRNNGETWNQLALIDTYIDKLTDVAPSADCTTVYLASTNNGTVIVDQDVGQGCDGFDSVWRTSSNPAVASPLPPLPVGNVWERVLCRPTATVCNVAQSEYAILRLAPDKEDGQIVFWAAGGAAGGGNVNHQPFEGRYTGRNFAAGANTQAVAWTPDYGDYWANINPRLNVQDMSAESSTTLYILQANGLVQRMPYTGTAWSSSIANGNALMAFAHTIDSLAEGHVLVGSQDTGLFTASYSADAAANFSPSAGKLLPTTANKHVEFDTNFTDNGIFFLGDDDNRGAWETGGAVAGTIYRNTIPYGEFENMLNAPATAYHQNGYFGLAVAYTGNALYGAHNGTVFADAVGGAGWCTVERTIFRYWPIPKPNVYWDHMNIGTDRYATVCFPHFTLEPSSLKQCGCLTMDTDTELFAIDNDVYSHTQRDAGMVWVFTDCLAKVGPALITEDGLLVGCDPVSGRNQEINFQWEQLCLAVGYDFEIAKDEAFTMPVVDYISTSTQANIANVLVPANPMAPAWIVPVDAAATTWVGGAVGTQPGMFTALECGHKYYWKVQVRGDAWAGALRSPWSEVRSFTIKAGLPVSTPYYGPQLLSPNNGCLGCPVSPASFSWSPFKGSTSYKFQLASDAAMTSIIAEDTTGASTGYEYDGTLDYSTNYFWRVMAVEPAPSDWSATFSFQTGAAPSAPPTAPEAPATPLWVWVVIALGAILVIVTLVLIFKTRRV